MAIRKIEMKPPSSGDYADVLYPKTSADIVMTTSGNAQSDIDTLKTGKAPLIHDHTTQEITDLPRIGNGIGEIPIIAASGKLDSSIIPAIAITDTFVVASETAMLALIADVGDIAVRTDLKKSFILKTAGAATLANWQELLTPTDTVTSVAGKTGAVTLAASDVGLGNVTNESKATMFTNAALTGTPTAPTAAAATNTTQVATTAYVKSQGYLTGITKAQVEAVLTGVISTHSHASGTPSAHASTHITGGSDIIPNFTATASGLTPLSGGGTANYLRADGTWATPPNNIYTHPSGDGSLHVPATGTTNNGKVLKAGATAGSIAWGTLSAGDITGLTIPTKTSDLTNDSGFITKTITIGTTQPNDGTLWFKEI